MEKAVRYKSQKTNLVPANDKTSQQIDGKNTLEKEVRSLKKMGTNTKENTIKKMPSREGTLKKMPTREGTLTKVPLGEGSFKKAFTRELTTEDSSVPPRVSSPYMHPVKRGLSNKQIKAPILLKSTTTNQIIADLKKSDELVQIREQNEEDENFENSQQSSHNEENNNEPEDEVDNLNQNFLNVEEEENQNEDEEDEEGSVVFLDQYISLEEEEKIKKSLKQFQWFQEITDDMLDPIMEELIECQMEAGKYLYEEGETGNYFYILKKGKIEVLVNNEKVGEYKDWDCFGELALIQKCKRTETVRCLTTIDVFILDGEVFREQLTQMTNQKLREKLDFLELVPTFKSLSNIEKNNLASLLTQVEFEQGQLIVKEAQVGDKMYIIKSGIVSCRFRSREIRKLYEKEFFGQNSILLDSKRSMDVYAVTKTYLYEVSRKSLEEALGPSYKETILYSSFKDILQRTTFFKELFMDSQVDSLFKSFKMKIYKNGEIVYCKDWLDKSLNKKIVILIEGNLVKDNTILSPVDFIAKRGEIFGENLVKEETLTYNVLAFTDCLFLEASWENIIKNLHLENNEKSLNLFERMNKLKKIAIFKNFSEPKLISLASSMKKQKFQEGEIIVQEGTPGEMFYLITKGSVKVTQRGKLLRELEEGNCFGEIALINKAIRTASVYAINTVVCYRLTKDEFDTIIDNPIIKEYLAKKSSLQDTSIRLKDLTYVKFLGKGKFGSVSLVHTKNILYAIKAVSRKMAEKQKILCKYFVSERKIMLQLDHPFIIKMVKTLKNENYCFFMLEYINGKNMDDVLNSRKIKRNVFETKFYIASILVMIDYLHNKSIGHRDIKPSNIMIEDNGYLKMIDFGTSKKIEDFTHTIIGTPHYIAPEVLLGKGYSLSCDYWSIGICMFEIFYGCYPFGANATDILEVYKDVLHRYQILICYLIIKYFYFLGS